MEDTKICNKCGKLLPIEKFRLCTGHFGYSYYRGACKECEGDYSREYVEKKREKEFVFSDDLEMVVQRKYKEIHKSRILDISNIDIDIILYGTDEIFKLMDYKDTWLSNYGRIIRCVQGKYGLLKGTEINGELRYSIPRNAFYNGKWVNKKAYLYAPKAVN